jgi:hypothetical protein
MKKIIILLSVTLLFHLTLFAQFPLYVFPMEVSGDPFADTLLNTSAIMTREGIKKIMVKETSSEAIKTFTSKTVYLKNDGKIDSVQVCFDTPINGDPLCVKHSIFYDTKGRMVEFKTTDNKGNIYGPSIAEHISEREIMYSSIGKFNYNVYLDTLVDYKYFNEKGQMVRLKQIRKGQETGYTSFYYNNDGLFDSVKYENTAWGTFIFKRHEKRKSKLIEMENAVAVYRWIYNLSGQCVTTEYAMKNQSYLPGSGSKYTSKVEVNYYYNTNGTLSKVTEKRSNSPKTTIVYSYSK